MSKIASVKARQVLDSRGNPTVEVDVYSECGKLGRASVPSGASTGTREALELRDADQDYFLGKSVLKAVANINDKIAPLIKGMEVTDQEGIDKAMLEADGTENKENFGATAILAVSMAACSTGATVKDTSVFD